MKSIYDLSVACRSGNLQFLQLGLSSPEYKEFSNHPLLMKEAILGGQLAIVKYLFTNKELPAHVDIHYQNDLFLVYACRSNRLDIVKYLLTSPDLKDHCNVNTLASCPIREACINGYPKMVKYLIEKHNVKIGSMLYNILLNKRESEKETKTIHPKSPKNLDDYKKVLKIIDTHEDCRVIY